MSPDPSMPGCETVGLSPGASTAPLTDTKRFEPAGGRDEPGVPSGGTPGMDEPGSKPGGEAVSAGAGCASTSEAGAAGVMEGRKLCVMATRVAGREGRESGGTSH